MERLCIAIAIIAMLFLIVLAFMPSCASSDDNQCQDLNDYFPLQTSKYNISWHPSAGTPDDLIEIIGHGIDHIYEQTLLCIYNEFGINLGRETSPYVATRLDGIEDNKQYFVCKQWTDNKYEKCFGITMIGRLRHSCDQSRIPMIVVTPNLSAFSFEVTNWAQYAIEGKLDEPNNIYHVCSL